METLDHSQISLTMNTYSRFNAAAMVSAPRGDMARQLEMLDGEGATLPRFVLADALVACYRDPDVKAVGAYRDLLVHRGVPSELGKTGD